ncbi:MAG: class I SAM-dependent methyltransferase [Candidatus Omnitrophica bacterium]|nr:class I SAM-dependent methyltransferase [Candidatus Omnitrophota bacterium]
MTTANQYKAKEHYRSTAVAQNYDGERFSTWYGRMAHEVEARALASAASKYFSSPGTVLDIPCGTGRLLPILFDAGLSVTGADISEEMLAVAKQRFADQATARFHKIDAEHMAFEKNAFDYVTSYRLMCHLPPEVRTRVLNEMVRVCKKTLVINYHVETWTPLYLFNRIFRKHMAISFPLTEADLRRELTARPDVELLEIRKLSWFERSSLLVVLRKRHA